MKQSKSGFTIVELLIVVVVIGILASIVIVSYSQVQSRARDSKRKDDVSNMIKALELYYSDNGHYPTTSGTNSSVNGYWYSSDTTSWSSFKGVLTGAIDTLPGDPSNSAGAVTSVSSAYNYAYFGGSYCGESSAGQMYIIVYRLESLPKEQASEGNCTTNELGSGYYATGASYYRSAK
jgi:type II secretion system protein G